MRVTVTARASPSLPSHSNSLHSAITTLFNPTTKKPSNRVTHHLALVQVIDKGRIVGAFEGLLEAVEQHTAELLEHGGGTA